MRYFQRKQKEAAAPRDMELMDEVAQLRQQLSEARQEISRLRKKIARQEEGCNCVEAHEPNCRFVL